MKILYIANERRSAELAATALRNIAPELAIAWAGRWSVAMRWVHDNRDLAALVVEAEVQNESCTSFVSQVRSLGLTAPVIVVASGEGGAPLAALKAGADEYVATQSLLADLPDLVSLAVQRAQAMTHPARPQTDLSVAPTFLQSGVERLPYLVRLAHDGRILDVNTAGLAAFGGATRRAVVGSSIYTYVPEEHRDAIRSVIRNARADTASTNVEFELVAPDGGGRCTVKARTAQLTQGEGEPSILCVFDAVTERQEGERQPGERGSGATRDTRAQNLADAQTALEEAERRHASEMTAAAAQLAERQAQFDAGLAQSAAARGTLAKQLREAEGALERAQEDSASVAVSAAERLTRREAELTATLADRLAEATATAHTLELRLADAETALQHAERRASVEQLAATQASVRQREVEVRLAQEVERQTQFDAELAQTATARETLAQQLREAEGALERAQQDSASVAAAAAERLTQREAEITATFAEAAATRHTLARLAAAQASQRVVELEVRLAQEVATRKSLERDLADIRVACEQAQRDFLDEAAAVLGRTRAHEALLEERFARELIDQESMRAEMQEDIRHLQLERDTLHQSLEASQEQLQRLTRANNEARENLERASSEHAAERSNLRRLEEKLRQAERMEAVGRLALEVAETYDNLLRDVSQDAQQWLATIDRDSAFRHQGELLLHELTRAAGFLRQLAVSDKKQASPLEPIDVNRVLRDLEPVLKRIAGDDIELVLPKTSSPVNVDVEAERVERILVNVASYGRQRMPFGGRLMIELATVVVGRKFLAKYPNVRPGDHVLITVTEVRGGLRSDSPIGPRKEPAGANTMRSASDTPGVDLGVLQGLIRDCGGHLWMKAEPTGDMVLKMHLPQPVLDGPAEPPTEVPRSDRGRSMAQWFRH